MKRFTHQGLGKPSPGLEKGFFIQQICERTPLAALPDSFDPVIITESAKPPMIGGFAASQKGCAYGMEFIRTRHLIAGG
jgi:hypothetical protein